MAAKKQPAAPKAPKKEPITRAQVDGKIAGLPDACERAKKELMDIRSRCEAVIASEGIVKQEDKNELGRVVIYTATILESLRVVRAISDSMRRFKTEAKSDLSLF